MSWIKAVHAHGCEAAAVTDEGTMNATDIMTTSVISVTPDAPLLRAAEMMVQYEISGLPVIGRRGKLAGIVTEGDFLRRAEIGTERPRTGWLDLLLGPGRLAEEYVHAARP